MYLIAFKFGFFFKSSPVKLFNKNQKTYDIGHSDIVPRLSDRLKTENWDKKIYSQTSVNGQQNQLNALVTIKS